MSDLLLTDLLLTDHLLLSVRSLGSSATVEQPHEPHHLFHANLFESKWRLIFRTFFFARPRVGVAGVRRRAEDLWRPRHPSSPWTRRIYQVSWRLCFKVLPWEGRSTGLEVVGLNPAFVFYFQLFVTNKSFLNRVPFLTLSVIMRWKWKYKKPGCDTCGERGKKPKIGKTAFVPRCLREGSRFESLPCLYLGNHAYCM